MFKPNKFLFPLPKENIQQKNTEQEGFSKPWLYESIQDEFPFPVPSKELYPEFNWPKSLCSAAPECKVSDDFQDLSPAEECIVALRYGCPLYLTHFSEFQSFGECSNIPIFEIGQTESKDYTEEDLEKIVENFKELQKSHRPPLIVLGHGEDQELLKKSGLPSAGWVSKVWKKGRQLFADFKEVPKQVVKAIKSGAYRFPSVEIYRNFVFNGQEFGTVLRRVALLGADIPRIKSLDDIVARYEDPDGNDEENIGSLCLPVMQANSYDENEGETCWLGGNSMEKITKPIKDVSGKFKVGEEILGSDGKVVGKLEEMADNSLVITLTAKGDNLEGEISGKDSGASATIGEPEVHNEEIELEIHEIKGDFTEGETITVKDTDISAIVKNADAEASKLIVLVTPAMMEELKKTGRVIVGQKSNAEAKVGKYPYPDPDKKIEEPDKEGENKVLTQLQEQVKAMETRLAASEKHNKELKALSESQGAIITRSEKERAEEKRDSHFKDIELWSEELKREGMAPAVVDELGIVNFARILDSTNLFEFAEGEEKKTLWETFSELMTNIVKKHKENALFVPLENLDKDIETDEIVPVGVDEDAAKLDKRVTKYAEENKVSYTEAYKIVTDAEAEKK